MNNDINNYTIYNLQTGQIVANINAQGVITAEGDPEAVAALTTLMHKDIVIREHQIDYDPQTTDEDFDPYPEENMCYFGLVTLRPSDPNFLKAFIRRLPYISNYGALPSHESS